MMTQDSPFFKSFLLTLAAAALLSFCDTPAPAKDVLRTHDGSLRVERDFWDRKGYVVKDRDGRSAYRVERDFWDRKGYVVKDRDGKTHNYFSETEE